MSAMAGSDERRRVVVTGIGPVSPIGVGRDAVWESLLAGRGGVRRIQRFDPSDLPVQIAGEVADFDPAEFLKPKQIRHTDRAVHFAVAAARLAWADAGEP